MPAESRRTTELRKIFDLPKTGQLPGYNDIEAFTSPVQQSRAVSLFPEAWQYGVRLVDNVLRNSFSRFPRGQFVVGWDQIRDINLPEGAPVHDLSIETESVLALTLTMQTQGRLVPGDVFCMEAIEAFIDSRILSPAEQPLTPLAIASLADSPELAPN